MVIGRNTGDPAFWKRYRGGTAGAIWIDREGSGDFQLLLRPEAMGGNLASPMWVGDRVFFLSDHEGIGNLYSCSLEGDDVTRHTHHKDHYARLASSDGKRIVYQVGGTPVALRTIYGQAQEVPVELGSPRTQRQPRFVPADRYLSGYQLDRTGKRVVIEHARQAIQLRPLRRRRRYNTAYLRVSGTGLAASSVQGPTSPLSATPAVSRRSKFSERLGRTGQQWRAHHDSRSSTSPGSAESWRWSPRPDGSLLAVTNHKFQLLVVAVASGELKLVDESAFGRIDGPSWSPDGKWVAYATGPVPTQARSNWETWTGGPRLRSREQSSVTVAPLSTRQGATSTFFPTGLSTRCTTACSSTSGFLWVLGLTW